MSQGQKQSLFVRSKILFLALAITLSAGAYLCYNYLFKNTHSAAYTTYAPKIVRGKVVCLHLLKEEHFLDYHNMFSDTVRKNLEFPKNITLGYTIAYLREEMKKTERGEQILYMIFDNKENRLIGGIEIRELNNIDPGQMGCWVNENYWGGGRFQEALHLINKVYFSLKKETQSYIVHVRLWNKRSFHALKKSGLVEAGYFYENGKPTRHLMKMHRSKVDWAR